MSKYAFTDTELALRWGGADGVMPEATPENAWKAINAAVDAAKLLKEHVETATQLLFELASEEKEWWLIRSLGYSDALEKQVCSALRTCCVLRDNAESSLRVCKEQRKRKEVGTEDPCSEDGEGNMMTAAELAEKMRVSRALVSRWTKEGAPCVFIGKVKASKRGARPRYDMQQVSAWLASRDARKEAGCE